MHAHAAFWLPAACCAAQVWYDNRADDLTKEGMLKGIEQAAAFILVSGLTLRCCSLLCHTHKHLFAVHAPGTVHQFLSAGVLQRPYCQMEIRHALALKKPLVLLHGELLCESQ